MRKNILSVLASGYILMFYSENMFWAHIRPDDSLPGFIATWLLYSLLAFVFLTLMEYFKVQTGWALFLCGAIFGWLAEGVIVQTTYENLPLSISFTALAWHAPISVWLGWYAVRKALQKNIGATLKIAIAVGVFYGLWAISWWTEDNPTIATPLEFAMFAGVTTLFVTSAYWVLDHNITEFKVRRRPKIIVGALLVLYFIVVTIPSAPIAIVVLPLLLIPVYFVLRRSARTVSTTLIHNPEGHSPPARNYLALFALPMTATGIYTLAYSWQLVWYTNWLLYLVTTPLGFVLLGISLVKVWRHSTQRINNF